MLVKGATAHGTLQHIWYSKMTFHIPCLLSCSAIRHPRKSPLHWFWSKHLRRHHSCRLLSDVFLWWTFIPRIHHRKVTMSRWSRVRLNGGIKDCMRACVDVRIPGTGWISCVCRVSTEPVSQCDELLPGECAGIHRWLWQIVYIDL